MRFILVGDMHLSAKGVKSRLDDTSVVGIDKLKWVMELAASNGIEVVIQTGDFFNVVAQPVGYLNKVQDVLLEYSGRVRLYAIGGNHDCKNDVFESMWDSALGLFFKSGVVGYLGDLETESGIIRGYSACDTLNTDNAEKVIGLVCHHWINEGMGVDKLVVNVHSLKKMFPNLKLLLAGHDHSVHGDEVMSGVRVIRPGSLLRITSAKEYNRIPRIAVVDTSGDVFYVNVDVARPYKEVFKSEVKKIDKSSVSVISKFVNVVKSEVDVVLDVEKIFLSKLDKVENRKDREMIKSDLIENGFLVG